MDEVNFNSFITLFSFLNPAMINETSKGSHLVISFVVLLVISVILTNCVILALRIAHAITLA